MSTTEPAQPLGLVSSAQLGQDDPERVAFEAWFGAPARGLDRLGDGYALSSAHAAWKSWQAGAAAERERWAPLVAELLDTELGELASAGSHAPVEDILGRLKDVLGPNAEVTWTQQHTENDDDK